MTYENTAILLGVVIAAKRFADRRCPWLARWISDSGHGDPADIEKRQALMQPHLNDDEVWRVLTGQRVHSLGPYRLKHLDACRKCQKNVGKKS